MTVISIFLDLRLLECKVSMLFHWSSTRSH